MFHLGHLCLGVRELDDGVRRVREETGLAHYDGGAFAAGIANTIFPLGEDACLEVEAVTAHAAEREARPPGSTGSSRTATGGCSGACAPTPSRNSPRSRGGSAAKWRGSQDASSPTAKSAASGTRPARRHPTHHHHRPRPRPCARHVLAQRAAELVLPGSPGDQPGSRRDRTRRSRRGRHPPGSQRRRRRTAAAHRRRNLRPPATGDRARPARHTRGHGPHRLRARGHTAQGPSRLVGRSGAGHLPSRRAARRDERRGRPTHARRRPAGEGAARRGSAGGRGLERGWSGRGWSGAGQWAGGGSMA
ncbi:VOC family protein [Streptomyces varsoviensis]|uniref:VOC family protein n=1 Tax=Streptomyces varsoviensis TaxID=67373 RepID=UPI0033FBEF85